MIRRATNGAANRFRQNFAGPRVPVERSAEMGADGEVVWTWRPKLASSSGRCIRPDRVLGASSIPGRRGLKSWSPRGEREVSRKPPRGESRVDPVALWSTRALLCTTAGAIGARLSLRPSFGKGVKSMQTSGDQRREKVNACSRSSRVIASAAKQIHSCFLGEMDGFTEPVIGRAFARPVGSQ